MKTLKKQLAQKISELVTEKFSAQITVEDLISLMEYPPDASMGDIAIPCFKLAKTLRMIL